MSTTIYATCTSPFTPTADLAEGANTFYVRAFNVAESSTQQTRSFTVDSVPPTINITGGPANGSNLVATSVTFTFTTAGSPTSIGCRLWRSDVNPPPAYTYNCTSPFTRSTPLIQNNLYYIFQIEATDAAGNSASVVRAFYNFFD